jgi:hypothetical protein
MVRQMMKYGVALIGLYVVVANASGFGKALGAVRTTTTDVTRTLQGR